MFCAKAVVALLGALLLTSTPASALTVRGDHDWVSNATCPDGWTALDYDDSSWTPVGYPWLLLWPSPWEPDPESRPFWDASSIGVSCTRRVFDLPKMPTGPAIAHVFVDDDYELWINGQHVATNDDQGAERPGEEYDVTRLLHPGRNVVALKIVDLAYEKGAYFSLDLPGLPQQAVSSTARLRALLPWAQFAAIALALLIAALSLRALLQRLAPGLARWPASIVALLTIVLAAACQLVLQTSDLYVAPMETPSAAWNWGVVALAAGLFLLLFALRDADGASDETGPLRGEAIWLVAILALAAVLRIWDIDQTPVGFYQDEATNGNDALELMRFDELSLWSDSVGGRPTLFLYLLGFLLKIFGVSYLSLKILPIALSIGSVFAVWGVARAGFGARTALWSAFFLAVSRWDVHYARMAWEVNCVPFFSAAGFGLFLSGLRRDDTSGWRIAGGAALLTVGLYTYAAYRAVPVGAAIFLGWALLRDRPLLRRHIVGLARAAIVAVAIALPLAAFAISEPGRYWERYNDVSLTYYISYYGAPLAWLHQIGKGFLSLNNLGDDLIRHNLPRASQLDAITGAFFLLGLATAARPMQQLGSRLLWSWFAGFLLLASLTRDAPHATRYLGLVAPAAIFAGLGAARLFARLRRALRFAPLVWLLAGGTAAGITALNAWQYFVVEANNVNADFEMNLTARLICERIRAHPQNVEVFWTSDVAYWAGGPCQFLARGNRKYHDVTKDLLREAKLDAQRSGPAIFIIGPEHLEPGRDVVARDEDDLPILGLPGTPEIQRDREGRLMFYVWELD